MFLEILVKILVLLWKICKVILMMLGFIFLIILFFIFFRYESDSYYSKVKEISKTEISEKVTYNDFTIVIDKDLELKNIKIYKLENSKKKENEGNIKNYIKDEIFSKDINNDMTQLTYDRYEYKIKKEDILKVFGEKNNKNVKIIPETNNEFGLKLTIFDKINKKDIELNYILEIYFRKVGFYFWLPD